MAANTNACAFAQKTIVFSSNSSSNGSKKKKKELRVSLECATSFEGKHFSWLEQGLFDWPGGIAMCKYLFENHGRDGGVLLACDDDNAMVVELGCGVGLVGILLAKLYSNNTHDSNDNHNDNKDSKNVNFIMTDGSDAAVSLCKKNMELNDVVDAHFSCEKLLWGDVDGIKSLHDRFNNHEIIHKSNIIVIAADCIWDDDNIKPLFDTVNAIGANLFLLTFVTRSEYLEKCLFESLSKENHWKVEIVSSSPQQEQQEQDQDQEQQHRSIIHIDDKDISSNYNNEKIWTFVIKINKH